MLQIKYFTFGPFSENTYVIHDENKKALLIDPGNFSESETQKLHDFIIKNELKIEKILLTHAHIDHVFGLQWASDTFGVHVYMHEAETPVLASNPVSAQRFGLTISPFKGEITYISENDTITMGEETFKIYHVPGHSPGSVAYHHERQNFMISGDVLFQGSIGRTDLPGGNGQQLLDSIRDKLFVLHGDVQVYSGHGPVTTIGFERDFNPFFNRL